MYFQCELYFNVSEDVRHDCLFKYHGEVSFFVYFHSFFFDQSGMFTFSEAKHFGLMTSKMLLKCLNMLMAQAYIPVCHACTSYEHILKILPYNSYWQKIRHTFTGDSREIMYMRCIQIIPLTIAAMELGFVDVWRLMQSVVFLMN